MGDFNRSWLPSHWIDEVSPTAQASPDAFIRALDDGRYELRAPDEPSEDDTYVMDLAIGQVVEFSACDDYGQLTIRIHEDGSYAALTPVPEGATQFWIAGDHDTMGFGLDEMVSNLDEPIDYGEPLTVSAYSWEYVTAFRFEIDGSGTPHFVTCAGTN